jgi:hypothetical protein
MAFGPSFDHNMAFGPAFGHNMAFGYNMAFGLALGHNMAFGPAFSHNMAFGPAFGHNMVFGHNELIKPIMVFGHNKFQQRSLAMLAKPMALLATIAKFKLIHNSQIQAQLIVATASVKEDCKISFHFGKRMQNILWGRMRAKE